jgi:type II secretory pathway pseudopilin PulG
MNAVLGSSAPSPDRLRASKRRRCGGFSIIEVMVVTAMMATVLSTICVGLRSGHVANKENQRRAQLTLVCSEVMDRLFHIPFGVITDKAATAQQLNQLFGNTDNLGTATLCSLRVPAGKPGFSFNLANFPFGGEFEVRVDDDLNGDGDNKDTLEGRIDLLRIQIIHDGITILESIRAAPPASARR